MYDEKRAITKMDPAAGLSPQDRVLRAAMDIIVERGLGELRLAEISRRTGMSTGHVLYYFGTKDRILIETLKWNEADLATRRKLTLSATPPGWDQLKEFIRCYLPEGVSDPVWALWVEAWAQRHRDVYAGEVRQTAAGWDRDLRAVLRRGRAAGAFSGGGGSFPRRLIALMDGLAIQILQGTRDGAQATALTLEQCRVEL